jgi:hypothetical protein
VAVGETDRLVTVETSPIALSIDKVVAPDEVHDNVEDCPVVMLDGLAVKLEMVGNDTVGGSVVLGSLFPPPPPPQADRTDSVRRLNTVDRHLMGAPQAKNGKGPLVLGY